MARWRVFLEVAGDAIQMHTRVHGAGRGVKKAFLMPGIVKETVYEIVVVCRFCCDDEMWILWVLMRCNI
jgi:hypothetical protein